MEDHLKNKDRLDQEWAALCSYGISSTDVAENNTKSKYNRPNAPLPYDHSRIVLNELTNANNSDYINASTIVSILKSHEKLYSLMFRVSFLIIPFFLYNIFDKMRTTFVFSDAAHENKEIGKSHD